MNKSFELENETIKWIRLRNTILIWCAFSLILTLIFDDENILSILIFTFPFLLLKSILRKSKELINIEIQAGHITLTSSTEIGFISSNQLKIEKISFRKIQDNLGELKRIILYGDGIEITSIPNRTIKKSKNEVESLLDSLEEMQVRENLS
jgi:hypothetical protein